MDRGNPFVPAALIATEDRAMAADAMGKGGTPPEFMDQPSAMNWNNLEQQPQRVPVDWNPVDATASLMAEGYSHNMLGVIPQVAGFESGPGDKNPGSPGWM